MVKDLTKALAGLLFANYIITSNAEDETVKLPSSCLDLEDGDHYLQILSDDDYQPLISDNEWRNTITNAPVVKATCNNGYTIINTAQDSNFEEYFTSFHSYHTTYSGPDLNDHVTWEEWWLPSTLDSDMKFSISDDCQTCLTNEEAEYGDKTVFYMTGDSFGCNWPVKNLCDFDADTLECYQCGATDATATDTVDSTNMYGKCGHMPATSYSTIHDNHAWCTEHTGGSIPSIGTIDRYCVCYKPSTTQLNPADSKTLNYHEKEEESKEESIYNKDVLRTVHLYQSDFETGTYRIMKPGTYIIEEDIEFDFNAGDLDDPNAEGAWYPTADQNGDYPGAGEKDGWYWLGFFAGITVEVDDVIIDLNGHEIKQSPAFYLQQRWFIGIELASKAFLDGQGPTWTGTEITFTSNTVVKNGIIGLSSHIGIHGSNCTDVTIEDVIVRNFETHGIQINEHNGLTIKNVEIGPSINGHLGLNGNYNLARITLPLLRDAAADVGEDKTMTFAGRPSVTFGALVDELHEQLDLMFNWAYYGEKGSGDQWEAAYKLFANPTGISRAGVLYGMVLRPRGASVFNYGKYAGGTSSNFYMENVEIHDLIIAVDEIVAVGTHWNTWVRDTFNAPVPFEDCTSNNLDPVGESTYIGNAWTDCVLALRKYSRDWWYLGRLSMPDSIVKWAESGETFDEVVNVGTECNFDTLGHVAKGAIGIRGEYMENSEIKNLKIYNIMNVGDLGSTKCGKYQDGRDGGMPLQDKLTNAGYGGTTTRAFSFYDVKSTKFDGIDVYNIMSLNGPAHGFYLYDGCEIELNDVNFKHISGGIGNDEDYSLAQWPNPAAEGCAISWLETSTITSAVDVNTKCVNGHSGCMRCAAKLFSKEYGSCTGDILTCEESTSYKTAVGTFGVSKDGKVSQTEGASQQYIEVINNPLFTETSKFARLHKELYHKSGKAQIYKNKLKNNEYYFSKPSNHYIFISLSFFIFLGSMTYLAFKLKKNDKNNTNKYMRDTTPLQPIIEGNENDDYDENKFLWNISERSNIFINLIKNKFNNLIGKEETTKYNDIDTESSIQYQEKEFFLPS